MCDYLEQNWTAGESGVTNVCHHVWHEKMLQNLFHQMDGKGGSLEGDVEFGKFCSWHLVYLLFPWKRNLKTLDITICENLSLLMKNWMEMRLQLVYNEPKNF